MCIKLCSETCAGIMSPTTPREPEKPRYRDMRDPRYRDYSSPEKPRVNAPIEDFSRDYCPEKRRR